MDDGGQRFDRGAGAREGEEEAVAKVFHDLAVRCVHAVSGDGVVFAEEFVPTAITEGRGELGRSDDVRHRNDQGLLLVRVPRSGLKAVT